MKFVRMLNGWLCVLGLDLISFGHALKNLVRSFPAMSRDFRRIKAQNRERFFSDDIQWSFPMATDRLAQAGTAHGGYFYQDLLVAQRIFEKKPHKHVDVASRIDGFVAHVAAFREIEVFDIRPVSSQAKNITFRQSDLMNLDPAMRNYADSISSLHALEHFGLGRYGDPINLHGHEDGFRSLVAMLRPGGTLYLSVPIGVQRVEFNAHKIFSISTILDMAAGNCELRRFTYIDPHGLWHPEGTIESCQHDIENLWPKVGYGLGIFEFEKTSANI